MAWWTGGTEKMKWMMLVFKRRLRKTTMSLLIGGLETTKKRRKRIGFRGILMITKRSQMMEVVEDSSKAGKRQGLQVMD